MSRYGSEGVTLVETLVALTVFVIGLIAVAGLASTSNRVISLALEKTDATLLASQTIERRIAVKAGRMAGSDPVGSMDGRPYDVVVDESGTAGLAEIRVTVRGRRAGSRYSIGTWFVTPP